MLSSIHSLICNGNIENLKIHIITSNFSKSDYQKVELFLKLFNIEYYFYPLEHFDIEKYEIPNWRNSQIANSRLFFQEILKKNIDGIDNLLYLDSDTIVVEDLNGIKDYNDGLYAVKDGGRLKRDYSLIGNITDYYNSGVLYINVLEWLNNDYQSTIINSIKKAKKLSLPDQDLLNCALSDNIKTLPFRYNVPPYAYIFKGISGKMYFNNKIKCISYDEVKDEKDNAKIIHSYGFSSIKPWESTLNPFYDEYMKHILAVNPDFKSESDDKFLKLISHIPTLYYSLILSRIYLPNSMEEHVKKIVKCIKK